jgi:spore coat polysaccharide biosynthesis predicted glycosyltransferase SpsG
MISLLKMTPEADYISIIEDSMGRKCALEGVFVSHRSTWQLADDLSDKAELKEHMFPVIFKRPDRFNKEECIVPMNIYFRPHRFSVDTWADLEFMNQIYQELTQKNRAFELPEVLKLLNENIQLLETNSHVHQRAIIEDIRQTLFIIDANKNFGFGHLMRCLELALQITERLSWPVTFMVDDDYTSEIIIKHGLKVIRGSLQDNSGIGQRNFIQEVISNFPIVILDIYWKTNLEKGWRQKLIPHSSKVIVLNRTESWAQEADQIIIPEVYRSNTEKLNLVGCLEYIIIRRDIRRVANIANNKTNDILAYLYTKEHKKSVKKFADDNDLSIILIENFREDFPEILASSRYFISGFGYSFYEALFLGTIPLTMPLTKAHEKAASFFYLQTRMPPLIIKPEILSIATLKQIALTSHSEPIKDGTKRIVQKIATIANASN